MKIWQVLHEHSDESSVSFSVTPCATKEKAQQVMKDEIDRVLSEGHFQTARHYMDGKGDMEECEFAWENENEDSFAIWDIFEGDDTQYYDKIRIKEMEVLS